MHNYVCNQGIHSIPISLKCCNVVVYYYDVNTLQQSLQFQNYIYKRVFLFYLSLYYQTANRTVSSRDLTSKCIAIVEARRTCCSIRNSSAWCISSYSNSSCEERKLGKRMNGKLFVISHTLKPSHGIPVTFQVSLLQKYALLLVHYVYNLYYIYIS